MLLCRNTCTQPLPRQRLNECDSDIRKGGIERLIFIHCSVEFNDVTDINEWCFYAKRGLIVITNPLRASKETVERESLKVSSCSEPIIWTKKQEIRFQMYEIDDEYFTDYTFFRELQQHYKQYRFGWLTCENLLFAWIKNYTLDVTDIYPDDYAMPMYWLGTLSWRDALSISPMFIPDFLETLITCINAYDPEAVALIPAECLSFGIVSYTVVGESAVGNDGSITITNVAGVTGVLEYSIDNVTWTTGNVFSGLIAGEYTIYVRDSGRPTCTSNQAITVPSLCPSFTAQTSVTDIDGMNSGTISITITSGGGTYETSLNASPFTGTLSYTGLSAGAYVLVVRDTVNLCQRSYNLMVVNNCVALSASLVSVVDSGSEDDGIVTVSVLGGSGTYSISYDNINYTAGVVLSGVPAGIHTIYIKDATNGCITTIPNVTVNSLCTASASIGAITGAGVLDSGTVTINLSGGSGNYQYSKDGITWQVSNVLTGFDSGTYTVYAKDVDNRCNYTFTNVIIPDVCAMLGIVDIGVAPAGAAIDGQIEVINFVGTLNPIEYSLSGTLNRPWQAINYFDQLPGGTYFAHIRDTVTGCEATYINPILVENLCDLLVGTVVIVDSGQANDGSITVSSVSGGSGTYRYSLDENIYQVSNTFINLSPGNYQVFVKDLTSGCVKAVTATVQNACATFSIDSIITLGSGVLPTGEMTIVASGSSGNPANYEYSLDGIAWQSSDVFTGLASQNYTVWVRDTSNGCVVNRNDVIISNICNLLQITAVTVLGSGLNPTGQINSISVINFSNLANLEYKLNTTPYQVSPIFTGLNAGTYTLSVRDNGTGCVESITVNIPDICNDLLLSATVIGSGDLTPTGQILLTGSAGSGSYEYSIDGGNTFQPSGMFTGLAIGTYITVVRDTTTRCQKSNTEQVGSICSSFVITDVSVLDSGQNPTGQVYSIDVSGGSGSYEYAIDLGAYQPTPVFTGLSQGTHILQVRDTITGCVKTTSVAIGSVCPNLNFSTSVLDSGEIPTGQINVTNVTGGSGSYEYSLDGGAYQPSDNFTSVSQGEHHVRVRDTVTGCVKDVGIIVGSVCSDLRILTIVATPGTLTVTSIAGNNGHPVEYSLDFNTWQISPIFAGLSIGSHTVYMRDTVTLCVTHKIGVVSN